MRLCFKVKRRPYIGDHRTRTFFAVLPRFINTRGSVCVWWLERITVIEEYHLLEWCITSITEE